MIWRDAYRTREHRIVVVVSHRARSKSPAPPSVRASDRALDAALPRAFVLCDRPFRVSIVAPSIASRVRAVAVAARAVAGAARDAFDSTRTFFTVFVRTRPMSACSRASCRDGSRRASRAGLGLASVDRAHTDLYGDRPTARARRDRARAARRQTRAPPPPRHMFAVSSTRVVVNAANTSGTKRVAGKKAAAGKVRSARVVLS